MDIDWMLKQNKADQQAAKRAIENAMRLQKRLVEEEKALKQAAEYIEARLAEPHSKVLRGQTMGLRPEDVDLTGTETLESKVRRVAERAPHGQVNLTEMTDLLMSLGVTEYERTRLRATLYQRLRRMPDARQIARGWWELGANDERVEDLGDPESAVSPNHVQLGTVVTEQDEESDEAPEPQPMKWQPGRVDYSGTNNLVQRLVRMAEHTLNHRMEAFQVATRLLADGQSAQRLPTLARLVSRSMRKHSRVC